jgi:hypothetical protein
MLSPSAVGCPSCGHPLRPTGTPEGFFLKTMNVITQAGVGILAGILGFALLVTLFFAATHFLRR